MTSERRTVLVVEDDVRIRGQLAHQLRIDGYVVLEAELADHALPMLQAAECPIDCVISDVHMPGDMNGVDLACWIMVNRPEVAVIVASAGLGEEQVATLANAAIPFIAKPFPYARVRDLLSGVFEARRAA
jgi:two-component system, response regulator PdtaR